LVVSASAAVALVLVGQAHAGLLSCGATHEPFRPWSDTTDYGLAPNGALDPISIVCKVISADGRPTVKLSDNPTKAMGPRDQIERYKRVFEVGVQEAQPVLV
jgi:hypothetical protein